MTTPANPISREEIETLGRYNAETSRGIAHTPEYAARMAELQRRFDQRMAYLDDAIDQGDAMLEFLRRTALPRWLCCTLLAVAVVFAVVNVIQWTWP